MTQQPRAGKRRLLFVSPRFLLPVDNGGRIRTTQILRGLRGGEFHVTLASPINSQESQRFRVEITSLCDRYVSWPEPAGSQGTLTRARHLFSKLPIPVASDFSKTAKKVIAELLEEGPDVVVFDFLHSAVLASQPIPCPAILFTHNVEAEIFERHAEVAENPLMRWLWRDQSKKMRAFEKLSLGEFDSVIAVAQRDADAFADRYGIQSPFVIPTGVDLDFFSYQPPPQGRGVVFTGSMDWLANVDGIEYLLSDVWPILAKTLPDAQMTVVGRDPPAKLVRAVEPPNWSWTFTGFVDDVRPYVRSSAVYVIPLRVGGGTRLKVFEAMAMGCPVVSTSIGVEGLPLEEGVHYLQADSAEEMADAIAKIMGDHSLAMSLSRNARDYVEEKFSFRKVARIFEEHSLKIANKSSST